MKILIEDAGLSFVCVAVLAAAVVLWNSSRWTVEKLSTQRDELKKSLQAVSYDFESSRAEIKALNSRMQSLEVTCRALNAQVKALEQQSARSLSGLDASRDSAAKQELPEAAPPAAAVLGEVPGYLSFEELEDQEKEALHKSRTALFRRTASGGVAVFNCDNTEFQPTPEQREVAIELANVMNELVDSEWLFAVEESEKRDPSTFCWIDAPEADVFRQKNPPPVLVEIDDKSAFVNTDAWHSSSAIGHLKERREQLSADNRLPCMFWVVTVQ